jgi:Eukaryotic aspartyl protease
MYSKLGPIDDFSGVSTFTCSTPMNMTFVIGGKNFPLDPRDFLGQQNGPQDCDASTLLPTDDPSPGGLMSWILGDPFMKS